MPQQVYMSRRAFIPPMVRAWCMHGPSFSVPSWYLSAFEFPASMIHPCWTATTTPWCPSTHSGLCARCPTAYSHAFRPTASPSWSCHTVTPPPSHLSLDTHTPWRTHTHTSTTRNPQPHYTTAATARLSPVTATAAIYVPPPPPSMCHRCHRLHATTAAVYVPLLLPSTCHHRPGCRIPRTPLSCLACHVPHAPPECTWC